jgi:hypothetical protein
MTVCGIAELALEFFEQRFAPAYGAVRLCNVSGAEISMVFRGVITDTDRYICVERANRRGTGGLERVTHGRSEIICVAVDGHQNLAPALALKCEGRVSNDGPSRLIKIAGAEPYAMTAIERRHPAASRQAKLTGMVPLRAGCSHFFNPESEQY